MMNLDTMTRVLDYLSKEESNLIEDILAKWGKDTVDIQFVRSSANFVFTFKLESIPYFLRFNHASERKLNAIEEELAFVNCLHGQGLKVAKPVPSLKGKLVETVSSKVGDFHAVVFEALEGRQYELEDLPENLVVQWGAALGNLHQRSSRYPESKRPAWQEQLDSILDYLPQEETAALKLAKKLEQSLASLPVTQSNYGLIHFDFELDNIVWQDGEAKSLDFDDCCYQWFIADVAFALRDLFNDSPEQVDLNHALLKTFVEGYRSNKPLPDEDLALIPVFLRFHNLLSFTKILRSLENLSLTNKPEWVRDLTEKLQRKINVYREGFEAA